MNELSNILQHTFQRPGSQLAITAKEEHWTYTDLQHYTNDLVTQLKAAGLDSGDRLGILLHKSPAFVGLITAAITAELPYVPLAVDNPAERISYIINDACCGALITNDIQRDRLSPFLNHYTFTPLIAGLFIGIPSVKKQKYTPPNLAFILYTSGSTGTPKGVYITHENAACFVEWASQTFSITEQDKVASLAPFHFDLSVFDLFATLKNGGQLFLFTAEECRNPRLLALKLSEHEISVLYATPSLLQTLNRFGKLPRYSYSNLRLVLFAGEVFPVVALREIKARWPKAAFYNLYGPTETNVVSWHPIPANVPAEAALPYPIGRLCPYAKAKLRQENKYSDCTPGKTGELLISGTSVSPGYVSSNETHLLTIENEQWYPTGDWVSVNEQGELVYQGRTDRMIKRRGYRIELAEIENAIMQHPEVATTAALAYQQDNTDHIGLCIETIKHEAIPALELKDFLLQYLPLYMLPDRFFFLNEFPLTSNQKTDLQGLKKWVENHV